MQDPDEAPVQRSADSTSTTTRCPICLRLDCNGHLDLLHQTLLTQVTTNLDSNQQYASNQTINKTIPHQSTPNVIDASPQTATMRSCATEDPQLISKAAHTIRKFNSQAATPDANAISNPHQIKSPVPLNAQLSDNTNVTAPLHQTNITLSQKSAKTIVLSTTASPASPKLPLPSLTSHKHASATSQPSLQTDETRNNAKSHVYTNNNTNIDNNKNKNAQKSGAKNVSATPIEEQKDIITTTMGALPPVGTQDTTSSPRSMALQAPMPPDSPSPTPVDILAPAPERNQTHVSAPQNYNTQTAQFNDDTINGRRVFGSKYRFNVSTSKLQASSRFITLRIVPDAQKPWEEVTSGSQALSYLHAFSLLMQNQLQHNYPCWRRLKPSMILNCAVEEAGLLYAIDTNWIETDNLQDFNQMVIQEFQDYVNSVEMTVFGQTPNICELRVPWDLTDNYTIVWVTAGMPSDNLVATKNMVGQHQAFIHECYDIATAFGLADKLAYGERGTTATKALELREQGKERELAYEEKQDRTYNLGYKLVFEDLTQEEKINLTNLQAQPWYGYNFRYTVEKADTTIKRALQLIPGCELCFQLHLPHQNCNENEPARKAAITTIKQRLRLQHPIISKADMSNLIYDNVTNLQACARCAGYHEFDIYHENGMCPHELSAHACKFCMTSEFEQQPEHIHDTQKSLRCPRIRADALTYVNRSHHQKQQAWKRECQHYNITPESVALRTNVELIIQRLDAINLNAADNSPAPPHKYLLTRQSVPIAHVHTAPVLPPQAASQTPVNPRKPPLRQRTTLNPNAPKYDPNFSHYTPPMRTARAPIERTTKTSNRIWNGTNLDSINENTVTTMRQGLSPPSYDPYIPLQHSTAPRNRSNNVTSSVSHTNNNTNSNTTDLVRTKHQKPRTNRRGGYKPPRIPPQPNPTRQRTKKYRKIPMIPKELQSATHTNLPTHALKGTKSTDKQNEVDIDSDLLD